MSKMSFMSGAASDPGPSRAPSARAGARGRALRDRARRLEPAGSSARRSGAARLPGRCTWSSSPSSSSFRSSGREALPGAPGLRPRPPLRPPAAAAAAARQGVDPRAEGGAREAGDAEKPEVKKDREFVEPDPAKPRGEAAHAGEQGPRTTEQFGSEHRERHRRRRGDGGGRRGRRRSAACPAACSAGWWGGRARDR